MQQPKSILMTQNGYDSLFEEQKKLLEERPAAVEDLRKAREMGDLSENGYYKGARAKLSSIDHRLRQLKYLLRFGKVQTPGSKDSIDIGSTVILESPDGEITYTIVGEHEANPSEKKISHKSPLGSLLISKRVKEKVVLITPSGEKQYKIIVIK